MDDIVKRIRQQSYFGLEPYEAADEIEQLRQRVQELTAERDELLAAMIHIQQVACSGSPELGIATNAIASVKEKQNAVD